MADQTRPTGKYHGRLELTWTNKDQALLWAEDGSYRWVPPTDFRVAEVRLLHDAGEVGQVGPRSRRAADNLLIRGDALNALTSLGRLPEFQKEYLGKVKLAYLDPPFNTQQAFPNYDDALEHSVWLTMMRDRLVQIKRLLREDGSVWVHLDDQEVHRCRCVLDEVFGLDHYVGTVIWQKAYSPRNDAPALSTDQDYILIYSKQPNWRSNRLDRTAERDALYKSPDGDPLPWVSGDPAAPSAYRNQTWVYAIQSPFTGQLVYPAIGRCWGSKQETMKTMVEEWGSTYELVELDDAERRATICGVPVSEVRRGVCALMVRGDLATARANAERRYAQGSWPRLYFTKGGRGGLKLKRYLARISQTTAPRTLWLNADVGHNRTAKAELNELFPRASQFQTPKPERLIQRILQIASMPGDTVLDCFLGSGTTAAVAHKMGRRWIGVERSADTLSTYAIPRLEKVVAGQDPGGITEAVGWKGGGGFRILDVSPSMFTENAGYVVLADWAVNGQLAEATAAQLGYELRFDPPFCAAKGRSLLAVIDGLVTAEVVELIASRLEESERAVVCGTAIAPEADATLKTLSPGSRVRKIPASILADYRMSTRRFFRPRDIHPAEPREGSNGAAEAARASEPAKA